jgi:hypothetical protein
LKLQPSHHLDTLVHLPERDYTQSMTSYDAWLEKPYQDRAAQEDAYVKWCEENDLDPDDDLYDDFMEAMEDMADDLAEQAAEARYEERMDREDYDY